VKSLIGPLFGSDSAGWELRIERAPALAWRGKSTPGPPTAVSWALAEPQAWRRWQRTLSRPIGSRGFAGAPLRRDCAASACSSELSGFLCEAGYPSCVHEALVEHDGELRLCLGHARGVRFHSATSQQLGSGVIRKKISSVPNGAARSSRPRSRWPCT